MGDVVRLSVPLIRQAQTRDCWYAAVNMVCKYHVAGPRNGVPSAWMANKGLPFPDFSTLAAGEHLVPIVFPAAYDWKDAELAKILREDGPIWAWGYWFGQSHIVVVTGIDKGQVLVNDPDGPAARQFSITDFNRKVVRNYPLGTYPLMVYRYPNKEKLAADTR